MVVQLLLPGLLLLVLLVLLVLLMLPWRIHPRGTCTVLPGQLCTISGRMTVG